jgi:hypothetical protein
MRHQCQVVHRIPGRVRFRVAEAKGNHELFRRVKEHATAVDGVHEVRTNPTTGSVVIEYDKHNPEVEQRLEKAFRDESTLLSFAFPELEDVQKIAEIMESDVDFLTSHSWIAADLMAAIRAVNLQLKRVTGNAVDLQLLFPLVLAGSSLLFIDGKKNPFALTMLLLASFHAFVTLHHPSPVIAEK